MAASARPLRLLITGATGFVGLHLAAAIRRTFGAGTEIIPTALYAGKDPALGEVMALDVTDPSAVATMIAKLPPMPAATA